MKNKVYNGDCLEIMQDIKDNSVDLIICDLPYGTTKCKWDVVLPFDKLWEQYKRICKKNAAILLFGMDPFSSYLRISNIKDYRYDWFWNKKRGANFLFMNKQPGKIIENISVFYESQPTYNPQKTANPKGTSKRHLYKNPSKITKNVRDIMGESWKPTDTEENYSGTSYEPDKLLPNTLIEIVKDTKRIHPTQKPVALYEYFIKTYSNENDLVLDNCAGSGPVIDACQNTNRDFIAIEKDKLYFEFMLQKLNNNKTIYKHDNQ